ncbi:carbohydrate ABC transporter permease [Streptococcus uberis]|uniref:Transport system permease n=2 Tax=Streptococcus uberis TaxID=1349 RepID=B9DVU7_STRU0|nr:sugar ABC transporter permease [Streptococcus uberis]KKF58172.1 sugar ABC transporter permease [Streptococcus uberis B362]KKF59357.1 sugar ABC transporter permease [Streptococcus uberis C6344]CAR43535.1 putative transport system permease [Streptococcus uberis 0140J]AUC25682.1 sugar ABC transporter permease [Streptococcus uberis]MBI0906690.1 sugar ABC transporter permease [Streptococcus uberis]
MALSLEKNRIRKNTSQTAGYLFIAPQMLLMLIFIVYPVIKGFKMSLYKVYGMDSYFVGLDNFKALFEDAVFVKSILNTVFFVVAIVLLTIIFALFVSTTVYDKNARYVSFIRGSYYLPVMVSMVVMSIVWNFLLNPSNGLVSYVFQQMGAGHVNLLGNPKTVMPIIVFVTFVGNVGQAIILYLATMIGISPDYFEAAQLDGATRWQRIRHIIIPLVRPTTAYLIVINIIAVLKIFVVIQLLTGGGPNNASVTMMYYLYQNAFVYNNTGAASAIGVLMFMIALILSVPQLRSFIKTDR